jgi:hypothetical protein
MASFEEINYSIRPNKNVERKLIFEALQELKPSFYIEKYRYVGLGSVWFVDFVLAHKLLFIEDLISIEKPKYEKRVNFNKPFRCIRVEPGDTTQVLPELKLKEKRTIVWLDYDSGFDGPLFEDLDIVCEQVPSGSIVLVTSNAHRNILYSKDEAGNDLSKEESLRRYAGDLVPTSLSTEALQTAGFPKLLASMLFDHLTRATRKTGRKERFIPMLSFFYKDNAPMITVGGMIADEQDAAALASCELSEKFDYITGAKQRTINVPPLTIKEKMALDQLLPSADPLTDAEISELGFALKQQQVLDYRRFYKHYPTYGEIQF